MNSSLHDEKEREEAKRNRIYDPVERWKNIQETITWAEANMPEHLRRNRPRVPKWLPRQKSDVPVP
jgi:hypothetical protein